MSQCSQRTQNTRHGLGSCLKVEKSKSRKVETGIAAAWFVLAAASGCHAVAAQPALTESRPPDLKPGAAQYPDDDAVFLRWEDHWTLAKDGQVSHREHRWVKLMNSRPIGRFGDPRIDYCDGQDQLIVHTAQSILPDGTVMPVPKYSFNLAGPDDVAGWPAYAGWRQQVICFSGIQDNVVLELDYEVVTQAGVLPWISAEVRLDDEYPVVERVVSVTVPEGTAVHSDVEGEVGEAGKPAKSSDGGRTTFTWMLTKLAGAPVEPQALPWRERSPRLRFTTCPSGKEWISTLVKRVEEAAQPSDAIKKFAEAAVKDEADPVERVRKVAKKLHEAFSVIESAKAHRSLTCRSADTVLAAAYGNTLESAAMAAAALRALGFGASVEVAVDALAWDEQVPVDAALAGVVLNVTTPQGAVWVHPQNGVFRSPGNWGKHWVIGLSESGLRATYIEARGEKQPSEIQITGKVTVDAEGKAAGELRLHLTGAFYDPLRLETDAQQESLVKNLVGRVFEDFKLTGHAIATLSDDELRATAKVASKDALKSLGARRLLTFGSGPAFLDDVPLPLNRSYRKTAVDLVGQVRETIDLTIELPEGWTAAALPASLKPVSGNWGTVAQQVEVDGRNVRFRRTIDLATDLIAPGDFGALRSALNELRAAQSVNLVCGK
jgi:hypothetical protein